MASYQARQRDPLVDPNTQAVLERRGRELLGVVLMLAALVLVGMLASYSPEDPGWMVATEEPAQNWFGWFGAGLASTLMIILGLGAWSLPLVLGAWGLRFMIHRGQDRAIGRVAFAVIAVAFAAVFAATHAPGADWPHSFGLGGLFGDTVLGAVLGVVPMQASLGLKTMTLISGLSFVAMTLFVTGFDMAELRGIWRFLITGSIVAYGHGLTLAGRGARNTARAALALQDRQRQRKADAADAAFQRAEGPVTLRGGPALRREPPVVPDRDASMRPAPLTAGGARLAGSRRDGALPPRDMAEGPVAVPPKERIGLLARMQGLARRHIDPAPEDVESPLSDQATYAHLPNEDRIRAKISNLVRARTGTAIPATTGLTPLQAAIAARREPSVTRAHATGPLLAQTGRGLDRPPAGPNPLTSATIATALSGLAVGPTPLAADSDADDWDQDDGSLPLATPALATPITDWDDLDDVAADDMALDDGALYDGSLDDEPLPLPFGAFERRQVVQQTAPKPNPLSRQARAEAQPRLKFEEPQPEYDLPPLSLLSSPSTVQRYTLSNEALEENARMLESVLDDYGVKGEIVSVRPGPVVTMYELEPAPGLKASRVIGLADDIARSMSALSARVSTVPGRTVIGIELPNAVREKVVLREILSARDFGDSAMRLPLALGKDIGGEPIIANLAKMPHLLIAGTTGSGKSVAINTMILSLLYKLSPEECRLIMIDPKMLELSVYDGIPHLLSPVVTDPKKAVVALKWVVGEMEERYRKMSKMGVRNIEGYNGRVREALAKSEMFRRTIQTGFDEDTGEPVFETEEFAPVAIPYIVVVVDEMADLMMVAGKEIEACIQRLAQMARASGIHLIMATQRPSVDVITGTIKANFPTRISFQVTSRIDSRTILGEQGAEQLLGMGDMLYMAGGAKITRIHGPFVSDEEVEEIVNHLKSYGPPVYMSGVIEGVDDDKSDDIDTVLGLGGDGSDDAFYDQAVAVVAKDRKCSTSYIQRKLGIGYNKAARLVEQMEENQVVTTANHVGKREILLPER
jgi:S-DNA-T family DNA segregation ATPase FtsK/SpoIIIE